MRRCQSGSPNPTAASRRYSRSKRVETGTHDTPDLRGLQVQGQRFQPPDIRTFKVAEQSRPRRCIYYGVRVFSSTKSLACRLRKPVFSLRFLQLYLSLPRDPPGSSASISGRTGRGCSHCCCCDEQRWTHGRTIRGETTTQQRLRTVGGRVSFV